MKTISCPRLSEHQKKSQTLIEVVLSIALAAMVISALLVLGAASSKTVSASLKRSQATKLAVAGLEAVRYLRDNGGLVALENNYYKIPEDNPSLLVALDDDEKESYPDGFYTIDIGSGGGAGENDATGAAGTSANLFERKIEISSTDKYNTQLKKVDVVVRWNTGGKNGEDNFQDVTISTILSNWNQ